MLAIIDNPTGKLLTLPTGSVICVLPAIAGKELLLPLKLSPLMRSVFHAGDTVGAITISISLFLYKFGFNISKMEVYYDVQ